MLIFYNEIRSYIEIILENVCYQPELNLQKKSKNASSLPKILRSSLFSIPSIANFYCNTSFTSRYIWSARKLNKSNLELVKEIDLTSNPTSSSAELLIKENKLEFGLYHFHLQVIVIFNTNKNVTNTDETFIEIIPTGLAVFALENGVSSTLIGSQQALTLSPSVFTKDMDEIITPDKLAFKFYCKTINPYSKNEISSSIDLATYKNNATLDFIRNQTCFGSKSELFL